MPAPFWRNCFRATVRSEDGGPPSSKPVPDAYQVGANATAGQPLWSHEGLLLSHRHSDEHSEACAAGCKAFMLPLPGMPGASDSKLLTRPGLSHLSSTLPHSSSTDWDSVISGNAAPKASEPLPQLWTGATRQHRSATTPEQEEAAGRTESALQAWARDARCISAADPGPSPRRLRGASWEWEDAGCRSRGHSLDGFVAVHVQTTDPDLQTDGQEDASCIDPTGFELSTCQRQSAPNAVVGQADGADHGNGWLGETMISLLGSTADNAGPTTACPVALPDTSADCGADKFDGVRFASIMAQAGSAGSFPAPCRPSSVPTTNWASNPGYCPDWQAPSRQLVPCHKLPPGASAPHTATTPSMAGAFTRMRAHLLEVGAALRDEHCKRSGPPPASSQVPLPGRGCALHVDEVVLPVGRDARLQCGLGLCAASEQQEQAGGKLQLLQCIGEGSQASVYTGLWNDECVAVKVVNLTSAAMSPHATGAPVCEAVVALEAQVGLQLRHPNLVPTLAMLPAPNGLRCADRPVVTGDAATLIVMEHCALGSLRYLLDCGSLDSPDIGGSAAEVLDVALDVCNAVQYMHARGVVHGDLKAANVLLTPDPSCHSSADAHKRPVPTFLPSDGKDSNQRRFRAKVSDFGESVVADVDRLADCPTAGAPGVAMLAAASQQAKAAAADRAALSNPMSFTLTHAAPELLKGSKCSYASDVYAVGVLLWELWSGRRPYRRIRSAAELLQRKRVPGSTHQDLPFGVTPLATGFHRASAPAYADRPGSSSSSDEAPHRHSDSAPPSGGSRLQRVHQGRGADQGLGAGDAMSDCRQAVQQLCHACWSDEPQERPSIADVLERLQRCRDALSA